jgi:hypothetical protein
MNFPEHIQTAGAFTDAWSVDRNYNTGKYETAFMAP